MAQIKKDAKIINMKLDKQVFEQLDFFCKETGLSRTVAVEKILSNFFGEYFKKPSDRRGIFR